MTALSRRYRWPSRPAEASRRGPTDRQPQGLAITPLAASRYRDRHGVSRKKSDTGDALVLANILRTDMAVHRPLPADSDQAQAIAVLARAQQDAVWNRQQIGNQIRSLLREYYSAALDAFLAKQGGLAREGARKILAKAPTPAEGSQLSLSQRPSALKRAGRVRSVTEEADRLRGVLRAEHARQPAAAENAFGKPACQASEDLDEVVDASFREHPDAPILLIFPGPRCPTRSTSSRRDRRRPQPLCRARGLKTYVGSAPITRASGKKHHVGRRMVKNSRLHRSGYPWAFSSLRSSPGAQAHYRHRRGFGDWHTQAQRHLFNRLQPSSKLPEPPRPG
ncbi:IS110 family transposase [Streptomyces sp. RP5T]|nr:IS110 family transposase [Streptomyces sp. RP5T]